MFHRFSTDEWKGWFRPGSAETGDATEVGAHYVGLTCAATMIPVPLAAVRRANTRCNKLSEKLAAPNKKALGAEDLQSQTRCRWDVASSQSTLGAGDV
jgi:hypothetical protein